MHSKTLVRLSFLMIAVMLFGSTAAMAGVMHARSVIGLGVSAQIAPHSGIAHAERHQGSKYRISHEQLGNNYTYGNAGYGHAHHHSGLFREAPGNPAENPQPTAEQRSRKPPVAGTRGTAQYLRQTWRPDAARKTVVVVWPAENFLQVDPAELRGDRTIVSQATIATTGGLKGTIALSARRDGSRKPKIDTRATGIFERVKFELVTHKNGVVSLRFGRPLTWTVEADAEAFDIALEASIEGVDP